MPDEVTTMETIDIVAHLFLRANWIQKREKLSSDCGIFR
jgi:hypothetical protein